MNKTIRIMMMAVAVVALAVGSAYAVPTVTDGAISPAGEWLNTGYNYYLDVVDPNEAGAGLDNIPDAYDIKHVVLLQELEGFGYGDGNAANDGIYLLIETYGTPSLVDLESGGPRVTIFLDGDFGNAPPPIGPGFDFSMEHTALANGTGQTVTIVSNVFGVTGDLVAGGGAFKAGSVIEYFIPSGPFNTPHIPFPGQFIGKITYDNGGQNADDVAIGTLARIPEPGTLFLLGSSLLSMLGFGVRFKK